MTDDDRRVGPCGKHCAVVDECEARGDVIRALRAENAELKDALLAEIKANVEFTRKQADEIARLREALKPFAEAADIYNLKDFLPSIDEEYTSFQIGLCRAARAAMGEAE